MRGYLMKRPFLLLLAAALLLSLGCSDDDSATAPPTPVVSAPTFDPPGGTYMSVQHVTIGCATDGATIYYTIDGVDPTESDCSCSPGDSIIVDAMATLRARAYKDGMDPSPVVDAEYIVIPDLVAYYPFDGDADDASGNEHHGTVHGASLTTDRFGAADAAYDFDGTDDYIELSDEAAFDFTSYTISFWTRIVTLPTLPEPSKPGYFCAVSKAGVNLGNYTIRLAKFGGASYCNLTVSHGTDIGNWVTVCYENIILDRYYHVVVTMSDEIRCYVDGALACTSSSMSEAIQTDGNVLIGRYELASSPFFFKGIIDDVRFYDRALSASEIAALHEAEN
ncbi:MAG: chitobiase/beta-hexosaminidase C-terminal domain-containing protein [Candidatus Krumholzibacteriota bacterium]|nr:chitobiase/beta-hexosaminidase C-terminal domain-containing protein [Candidatus Krumholzibacteriota bacterium]